MAKTETPTSDLVRTYLREIGRVPLLTHEEEVVLGKRVQQWMKLQELRQTLQSEEGDRDPSDLEWAAAAGLSIEELRQQQHLGEQAKRKMIEANLRLVVSVAKKISETQYGPLGFDPRRDDRHAARRREI